MRYILVDPAYAPGPLLSVFGAPGHPSWPEDIADVSFEEILERCDVAGISYEDRTEEFGVEEAAIRVSLITVPDDPDAAFAFRMFVQP